MKVVIELDEKQLSLLDQLCKFRKDDNSDDFLDETFLTNIFKIGLIDAVRFYSKDGKDTKLIDDANLYMAVDMLDMGLTATELEGLWN